MRKKLTRTTLQRHIKDWTRKVRRGASSVIVGVLIEASILHVGMKEVSGISETKKQRHNGCHVHCCEGYETGEEIKIVNIAGQGI